MGKSQDRKEEEELLTGYSYEGPSVPRVQGHHASGRLRVEAGGPRAPLGRELRGAVEETLLEDGAAACTRHPPLVLGAAVGTVALEQE